MSIPRIAAEWIVAQLPDRQSLAQKDASVNNMELHGLNELNIKELKLLEPLVVSTLSRLIASSSGTATSIATMPLPISYKARKQERVDHLRRLFYIDDDCSIPNDQLLQGLQSDLSPTSRTVDISAPIISSSLSSAGHRHAHFNFGFSNNTSNSIPNQQQQHQSNLSNPFSFNDSAKLEVSVTQPATASSSSPSALLPSASHYFDRWSCSSISSTPFASSLRQVQQTVDAASGDLYTVAATSLPISNNNFSSTYLQEQDRSQRLNSSSNSNNINTSLNINSESIPQNSTEALLLPQLLEMGFEQQEILDTIRHQQLTSDQNTNSLTADTIMISVIQKREEAEEARKEDEIRLLSEEHKQDEINRREQNLKKKINDATTRNDLLEIFPNSWVLEIMADDNSYHLILTIMMNEPLKDDFVEVLKLEQKSRLWYGYVLPSYYFKEIGNRLKTTQLYTINHSQHNNWWLQTERETLRRGLFELEEQENQEPKIFRKSRYESNQKLNVSKDEVIVIDDD